MLACGRSRCIAHMEVIKCLSPTVLCGAPTVTAALIEAVAYAWFISIMTATRSSQAVAGDLTWHRTRIDPGSRVCHHLPDTLNPTSFPRQRLGIIARADTIASSPSRHTLQRHQAAFGIEDRIQSSAWQPDNALGQRPALVTRVRQHRRRFRRRIAAARALLFGNPHHCRQESA